MSVTASQWYYSVGGQRSGPISPAELKSLANAGKITPADLVWKDGMAEWVPASKLKGLLPPAAPSAPVPVVAHPTPAAPPRAVPVALPPPPPVVEVPVAEARLLADNERPAPAAAAGWRGKLAGLGTSLGTSTKAAMDKVKEGVKEAQQSVATAAAARTAAAKAAITAPSATPGAVTAATVPPPLAAMPPLALRPSVAQHRDTGELAPLEFGCCWNDLEKAGLRGEDLLFFCATKTRHEGSLGNKMMSLFSGKSTPKPVCHLAVFREEAVLLYVGPEDKPAVASRYSVDALTWRFAAAAEMGSGITSLFKKPTHEEHADRARTVILTLGTGDAERQLHLYQSKATDDLKQLLVELVLGRAEARIAESRYHQAEQILDRFPPGSEIATASAGLREKIGTVAAAAADYQSGHPEYAGPARGILRFDALGIEFYEEETNGSWRLPYASILKLFDPRPGRFPPEYIRSVELTRKAAAAAMASAKLARRSHNSVVRMGADVSLMAAKMKFASAKVGPPFQNRLILVARIEGRDRVKLIFDIAGGDRRSVEEKAATLYSSVSAITDRFAAAAAEPRPAEPAASRAKIVGCPKCQAKLRAAKPGVIQCPRCLAKVRVQESQFLP